MPSGSEAHLARVGLRRTGQQSLCRPRSSGALREVDQERSRQLRLPEGRSDRHASGVGHLVRMRTIDIAFLRVLCQCPYRAYDRTTSATAGSVPAPIIVEHPALAKEHELPIVSRIPAASYVRPRVKFCFAAGRERAWAGMLSACRHPILCTLCIESENNNSPDRRNNNRLHSDSRR